MAEARSARTEAERRLEERAEEHLPPEMDVRDEDLEPHEGLRYIARLFKILAILLILLLIGEAILGLVNRGNEAIPTLLVEATRIIVFAGLLWAAGDMALMLIESNHDLRATRILVGRLNGKVSRLEAKYLPKEGGASGDARSGARAGGSLGPGGRAGGLGEPAERPPSHREDL
ncbi:hypothetical protein [Longimicrobium sp.]|uniref:hypothetical protein n=1 Tax=Longimicrobium sp. TaxID=2029185 RepID=UPI002C0EC198|nr:hypothetical protein [Longimicrobium sp.]HSU16024.1 hypothetical protein [Longimicrobium sp.]